VIRGTLAALAVALIGVVGPAAAAEKQAYPAAFHAFALSSCSMSGTQLDRSGALVLARSGISAVVLVALAADRGPVDVTAAFTADGNPIVNDPASPDDASVRHVYDRTQFEDAWMSATGGIVYVIYPSSVPHPPSSGNW